jgi:hypothetical protein
MPRKKKSVKVEQLKIFHAGEGGKRLKENKEALL